MSKITVTILSLGLLFGACTSELAPSDVAPPAIAPSTPASDAMVADAEMHQHEAICGCQIEGNGTCGTYIKVEGEFVPLVYAELSHMEFCAAKENGAQISVAGKMEDGKFVASSYERVN